MYIVDSQVHIWGANTPERPWLPGGKPHRSEPLGKDELLAEMEASGVDRVVIVPPSWEGERNDLALEAAQSHPDRFAIMGRINPQAQSLRGTLASFHKLPGMLGLRFTFTKSLQALLVQGGMNWVWAEAEKASLPVYVLVSHALVPLIDAVAERHPELKIAMDHLATTPGEKDKEAFREFDKLLAIAKRPNVAAKLSGLPTRSTEAYPYRNLHPYIRQAYDAFGPERLFWGTDLSHSPLSYRQNITMYTEEIPWLTTGDKEWIMGKGVCQWLNWKTT